MNWQVTLISEPLPAGMRRGTGKSANASSRHKRNPISGSKRHRAEESDPTGTPLLVQMLPWSVVVCLCWLETPALAKARLCFSE